MDIAGVLAILAPIAAAARIGSAVVGVYKWLKGQRERGADPDLLAALGKLPPNATADDIVQVVTPFMSSVGGNVSLAAGNDGGGNVHATDPTVRGGAGTTKGGDVAIQAGHGGPHGDGGNVTIVGGTIEGGPATRK